MLRSLLSRGSASIKQTIVFRAIGARWSTTPASRTQDTAKASLLFHKNKDKHPHLLEKQADFDIDDYDHRMAGFLRPNADATDDNSNNKGDIDDYDHRSIMMGKTQKRSIPAVEAMPRTTKEPSQPQHEMVTTHRAQEHSKSQKEMAGDVDDYDHRSLYFAELPPTYNKESNQGDIDDYDHRCLQFQEAAAKKPNLQDFVFK